jgi:hypothetical protein
MGSTKLAQTLKAATMVCALAAVSLTNGVGEAFAGVPTVATAPAVTAPTVGSTTLPVYWHGRHWRGYGWQGRRGLGWNRGWAWGRRYALGGPVISGGCWRWRATAWGPWRVWVC